MKCDSCKSEIDKIVFVDEESQYYHIEDKGSNSINLSPGKGINSETTGTFCPECWEPLPLDKVTINWV